MNIFLDFFLRMNDIFSIFQCKKKTKKYNFHYRIPLWIYRILYK